MRTWTHNRQRLNCTSVYKEKKTVDLTAPSLTMDTNMKALLCVRTLCSAVSAYPDLRGAIVHSGRGSQYTSQVCRAAVERYGTRQSMNSDGGRYHDNARCESMWARMKGELFYDRFDPELLNIEELKALIWRCFMRYSTPQNLV